MCENSWSLLNAKENQRIKGEGEKRAWEGSKYYIRKGYQGDSGLAWKQQLGAFYK